jgi:tetratricopeptide (TPR) repeat protein
VYIPEREGSLQIELLAAARRHGRVPYVLRPQLETLATEIASGNPVIVLQNLSLPISPKWHYAVAVGFDLTQAEIVLRSGDRRRHIVPLELFERTWRRGGHWAFVALAPDKLPQTAEEAPYLQSVVALEKLGRYEEAAVAYKTALKRWPRSLGARMGLGNSLHARGDRAGAERAFRDAARDHPDSGAAHNNLAQVLADAGSWEKAEAHARRAIELGGPQKEIFEQTLARIQARSAN